MIKVYFEEVGRNNISFERICKDKLTYEWLIKQVRPHCMSENLDFTYNEKTGEGKIFGVFRKIGKFKLEIKEKQK